MEYLVHTEKLKQETGTWVRGQNRRNVSTACWRRAGTLRPYYSTQRSRWVDVLWEKVYQGDDSKQVAEGRAELRKQQNLYHRSASSYIDAAHPSSYIDAHPSSYIDAQLIQR